MDNNNKYSDVLGCLLEQKPREDTFATTILHDVLGALEPKINIEITETPKNDEIPELIVAAELPPISDIPGFELPEPATDNKIEKKQDEFPFINTGTSSINKKEKSDNKILDLEHENKKLKAILANQKKEMDTKSVKLAQLDSENNKLRTELSNAKDNLRSEFEAQLNKAAIIEEKYNQLATNHEELKAKVRRDIRKIRLREKELTHKMELMKNDSETLLSSKDQKILQLKKYNDSLEFDIETLKEKIESLEEKVKDDDEKAQRVVRALRLSTSLLETNAKKKII